MSEQAESPEHHDVGHHEVNYVRIWQILLVLLVISVAGPFLEIQAVTLITAFGIAIVKAYLVAKNFMHLKVFDLPKQEKKLVIDTAGIVRLGELIAENYLKQR